MLEKLTLAKIKECFGARRVKCGGRYAVSPEAVKFVYENTSDARTPLRVVIINEMLRFWFSFNYPNERSCKLARITGGEGVVLLDLLEAIDRHISRKDCWNKNFCYFHGGRCLVCKEEGKMTKREKMMAKAAATDVAAMSSAPFYQWPNH